MNSITTIRMACECATETGARCRNLVDGHDSCQIHERGKPIRPADTILVKFRLNRRLIKKFRGLGVQFQETRRNDDALNAKHAAHAAKHGRKANTYRATPDSGVPVFTKDGISMVSAPALRRELWDRECKVQHAHLYQKEYDTQNGMATLVVEFAHRPPESNVHRELPGMIDDLLACTYEHCHVWSNPPDESGVRVETVNFAHRKPDEPPSLILQFFGGQWHAEPQ